MDINNYKFYVRDIGIEDADLTNILNDVISDIAINTKIFKRVFGFTLEPTLNKYPIKDLYQIGDKTELIVNQIDYTADFASLDALLTYLQNEGNIDVTQTIDETTDGTYSDYISVVDIFDNKFNSYMSYLEPVGRDEYWLTIPVEQSIPVAGIAIVNPLVSSITTNIEKQIRFAIISGLKAYTHTAENQVGEQVSLVLNKQFEYDKQKLMNKYPNLGLSKAYIRNRNFKGL